MCNASCCVSSSQTQANTPALPVWFLPAAFHLSWFILKVFALLTYQGGLAIYLLRLSFYGCAIWLAEHKFSVNYVYLAFVKQDDWFCVRNNIFLKIQEQMRNSWKVISSVAIFQRCWDKLGWCHITYNSESSCAKLLMRTGCSRKANFLRTTK